MKTLVDKMSKYIKGIPVEIIEKNYYNWCTAFDFCIESYKPGEFWFFTKFLRESYYKNMYFAMKYRYLEKDLKSLKDFGIKYPSIPIDIKNKLYIFYFSSDINATQFKIMFG